MGASGLGALFGALRLASQRGVTRARPLGGRVGGRRSASCWRSSRCRGSFWLSAALLVPVGFAMMVQMASSNTLIQAMVPDRLRGRVMSVYSMMFMGMAPFGALFAGVDGRADRRAGHRRARRLVCVAAAARSRCGCPPLRVEARRLIVAQGMAGGEPATEMTGPGAQVPLDAEP